MICLTVEILMSSVNPGVRAPVLLTIGVLPRDPHVVPAW
jgi:hypothetical protein